MLNRFFSILGDPILMNKGFIYQYAGDEIIYSLGRPEYFILGLKSLGRQHNDTDFRKNIIRLSKKYRLKQEAIEGELGYAFTHKARYAWQSILHLVTQSMQSYE